MLENQEREADKRLKEKEAKIENIRIYQEDLTKSYDTLKTEYENTNMQYQSIVKTKLNQSEHIAELRTNEINLEKQLRNE